MITTTKTHGNTISLQVPNSIGNERITHLTAKNIDGDIAAIDLEMVKMKASQSKEGIGWTIEQCEDAEIEYKRYLTLCRKFPHPHYSIVPNKIMDTLWHYHILDTRAYCTDCNSVFGGYFHHFPYFGLRGKEDEENLKRSFEKTKQLYEKTFYEPMAHGKETSCWNDCESRCWHECSN